MTTLALIVVLAFTVGFMFGRWTYRRALMKGLARLAAHPSTGTVGDTGGQIDHDAIRRLIEQYGSR